MLASVSNGSGVSNWADAVFSKLDTKKQGYIEQADLASALGALNATGASGGKSDSGAVDDMFSALDGDGDGKLTKSALTDAMSKLSDQLNTQFDASRVQGGMRSEAPPAGGMQGVGGARGGGAGGAGGPGGAGATGDTDSSASATSTTSADYVAAADTDGDGTVSETEQAAYDKKLASGEIDQNGKNGNGAAGGATSGSAPAHANDPMRDLAQALHKLKAYADNSGSSDASAASTAGVSVDA